MARLLALLYRTRYYPVFPITFLYAIAFYFSEENLARISAAAARHP